MSTPLFIRTPTNGTGTVSVLGASLAAYSGATPMVDLTALADEPTLVEDVAWCVQKFSTAEGTLILGLVDASGNRRLVGAFDLAAGSATVFASGRVELELTIQTGFKLVAAHNVKDGGAAFTNVDLVPLGGVVR